MTVYLNFHGVGTPGRDLEPGEAPYWIAADVFAEIAARVAARAEPIGITFDDGNASDLEICAPILARHGLTAEIFVLSDRTGQPGSLSAADLVALREMGMTIGTHGAAHIDWRKTDDAALNRELTEARALIAEAAGAPVEAAAIPFNAYDARVLKALKAAGYARVYASDGVPARAGVWPIPRTSIRADMDMDAVDAILAGKLPPLLRARRALGMMKRRML